MCVERRGVFFFLLCACECSLLDSANGSVWRTSRRANASHRLRSHLHCASKMSQNEWWQKWNFQQTFLSHLQTNATQFRTIKLKKETGRRIEGRHTQFCRDFFFIALMVGLIDVARRRSLCVGSDSITLIYLPKISRYRYVVVMMIVKIVIIVCKKKIEMISRGKVAHQTHKRTASIVLQINY